MAIARAFVHGPRVLFADEPTGNLDQRTGHHICDLLFALNRDHRTTLVLVTHDATLAARCERRIELEEGRVVARRARAPRMNMLLLALRSLRREWHLPELRTLAASLVLAVVALGVVATLATRIERGMLASAAELIGGDIGIVVAAGAAGGLRRRRRARDGLRINRIASFPSVAFAHGADPAARRAGQPTPGYPLRGTLELRDAAGHALQRPRARPRARSISITAPWSRWTSRSASRVQLGGRELTHRRRTGAPARWRRAVRAGAARA